MASIGGTETKSENGDANTKEMAEKMKADANACFKLEKFAAAEELYTKAIELDNTNSVYYANRSITHLKQENFGYALADASKAIELDASYTKAYYRYTCPQVIFAVCWKAFLPQNARFTAKLTKFSTQKSVKKFVKLCLHSSYLVQNSFHFDEIFHKKKKNRKKNS